MKSGTLYRMRALKNTPILSFPRRRGLGDRFQICPRKGLDFCFRRNDDLPSSRRNSKVLTAVAVAIRASLYAQYMRLLDNIEYHLMGNHLLENGFSLLFGGVYFGDARFCRKAEEILREELAEQILPDGGHYERSPMYHQIILGRVLDCINLLKSEIGGRSPYFQMSVDALRFIHPTNWSRILMTSETDFVSRLPWRDLPKGRCKDFSLTVDLFMDYRADKLLNWLKTT